MNRKNQLIKLIIAKSCKFQTQDLKKIRDFIENLEEKGSVKK